jgi:hypothetical protein
VVARRNAAKYQ